MSIKLPRFLTKIWAQDSNNKHTIPVDPVVSNDKPLASLSEGFPPKTFLSVLKGGRPPSGLDFNGILNEITKNIQWIQAGGNAVFNQEFCNSIGGYPIGCILQTSDMSKPWVFWINLVDGNTNDPNVNAINKVGEQNGWLRYSTISTKEGNIQYFDDDGKSIAASASVSTETYVSSSKGNDDTGLGTRESPYKTIYKAITALPGAGTGNIYVMAEDTHDFSAFDNDGKLLQYIGLSSRNINVFPYSDNVDTQNLQTNAVKHFEVMANNGFYGYCITNLVRPTLVLNWSTFSNGSQYFCGLYGTDGIFSVNFYGINVRTKNVDQLSNLTTSMASSWLWNGGSYNFVGTTWETLPYKTNSTGNSFIQGWSGSAGKTQINFLYRNLFHDSITGNSVFFGAPRGIVLDIEDYDVMDSDIMGPYTFIDSNAEKFLARNSVFNNTISYVNNPSKSYSGVTCNIPISGVS